MVMYDIVESTANAGKHKQTPAKAIIRFFLILFNIMFSLVEKVKSYRPSQGGRSCSQSFAERYRCGWVSINGKW